MVKILIFFVIRRYYLLNLFNGYGEEKKASNSKVNFVVGVCGKFGLKAFYPSFDYYSFTG